MQRASGAIFTIILLCVAFISEAAARFTATAAFESAPVAVMPLIEFSRRVEMRQLYEAGMAEKADPNVVGGPVKILSISPDAVTLSHATDATLTVALLPMASGDTAIMMLENLPTPALDANVRIYDRDWNRLEGLWPEPQLEQWALPKKAAEAAEAIPFMLASGEWDSRTATVTLIPTVGQWLDDGTDASALIRPQLRLKWNGKKFIIKK